MAHFIPSETVAELFIGNMSKHVDFLKSLSQIKIQNSRLTPGSLCLRLWKQSCNSAQLFIQRRIDKQNVWTRLSRWCWGTTMKIIWMLGESTSPFSNLLTAVKDTLQRESRYSHYFLEETLIDRCQLSIGALNHKLRLLRPCWNLFTLLVLTQETACSLHRRNKPSFKMNIGSLVIYTLET